MRLTHLVIVGSMFAALPTAPSYAQDSPPDSLRQPISAQRTAYEYDNYLYIAPGGGGSATAGDRQAAKEESAPTVPAKVGQAAACDGCESCGCDACRERRCGSNRRCRELGEPWTVPQPCLLANRGITVGGWASAGIYANQYGTALNGPVGMRPNNLFNLDQLNGYAERVVRQESGEWDWGGRIDYMFGVDAPDTQAIGDHTWDYGWNSSTFLGQPLYGSALPQAYVDVAYGDFKLRGGHFYTPIGYETVPVVNNFFYSHSYVHTFGEPFTHTGLLASLIITDRLTVYGGWVDGWDGGFDNRNDASMFLGGLTYKLRERTNIAWYFTWGDNGNGQAFFNQQGQPAASQGDMFMNSFVLTHELTSRWTYVFQADYADNYNLPAGDAIWYGINQYLFYKVSESWGFGGRFEWFRDKNGVRVVQGNDGDYYEMAAGVNWKPHANVMIRPELRYDWYNGAVGGNGSPFNNGNSTTQFSGGCDVIFTF